MKTITKGFIAGLKPKKKRYDQYEDCLHTWVTPTGRVGFAFLTHRDGKRIRYPIATFPDNKLDEYQREEVQRRYADLYVQHTNSVPTEVIEKRQLANTNKLVKNLFDAYIEEHLPTLRKATREQHTRVLNNTLKDMHSIRLADLSKRHLLDARRALNGKPGMQRGAMDVLRGCLNWGEKHEWIAESPWRNMPATKSNKRTRVLKPDEIKAVWDYLNPMLRFILLTAQRSDEVMDLEWADLEIGAMPVQEHNEPMRYPTVRWTQPDNKTGVPHVLSLPPLVVAQLPHWIDAQGNPVIGGNGAVFKSQRTLKKYSGTRAIRYMLERGLERMEVPPAHFTVHDLRRTALTNIARLMQSGEAAERVANHSLGDVASRYNLYEFEDLKAQALTRWSVYVGELVYA